MSETSPKLALPFLMQSQAQKHVTHNEALQILDALVQLTVEGFDALSPPASPAEGVSFALGTGPGGAWAGQDGMLAIQRNGAWVFLAPQPGWRAWATQTAELRVWNGASWELPRADTQNLGPTGIGTSGDAINRLAVQSEASLFTHAGAGHQMKVNKAGASENAAFLFQSGWSGRAEIGLLGTNDFALKVSGDGGSWQQAMTVMGDTGRAGFGTSDPDAHLEVKGEATTVLTLTASGTGQDYLQAGDGSALAFRFDASGNGSCAGAWTGGGADYAEYFEWADGNPGAEDRRGTSVVAEDGGIRAARLDEDPIGVISGAPCVLGNDDLGAWQGKFLRDRFGALQRGIDGEPLLNPAFDSTLAYVPRAARAEWAQVGLIGRLRLKAGQSASPRWLKLAELPDGLQEWLVR